MILVLSEPRTIRIIRSFENLGDEVTAKEIEENMGIFGRKLFEHVANFGLQFQGIQQLRGELGDFKFALTPAPYRQGDPRNAYLEAFAILQPINISVEAEDIPLLLLNPVMQATARDNFSQLQPYLTKILPATLLDALETACRKIVLAPPTDDTPPEIQAANFEQWCLENGLRIPGQSQHIRDNSRSEEIRQRSERLQRERESRESDHSDWGIREF